jgi:hypothetical protein
MAFLCGSLWVMGWGEGDRGDNNTSNVTVQSVFRSSDHAFAHSEMDSIWHKNVDCIGKPTLCPRIFFLNQARCEPKTLFTITSTTTTSITFLAAAVAAAAAAQLFWGQANVFERVHGMIVRNTSFFTVS